MGDIVVVESDLAAYLVFAGVEFGDFDRDGVEVEGGNGVVAEFSGGDGEEAGTGADIEEGGVGVVGETAGEFLEAELGGGVVSGSEAESRVEGDDVQSGFFLRS